MNQLCLQQAVLWHQLQKYQANYRKDSASRNTFVYYEKLEEKLEGHYAQFFQNNAKILETMTCERYDNVNLLLNAQFKKLFNLSLASESSSSLKMLFDSGMEAIQAIENLKVANVWYATIIHVMTQRLPPSSRQLWEHEHGQRTELPTLEILKEFMSRRFRTLEAAGINNMKSAKSQPISSIRAYTAQIEPKCILCKKNHLLRQCQAFQAAEPSKRFDMAKQYGLCINCLSKGHRVSNCPSKGRCLSCGKSHHTLLHRSNLVSSTPLNEAAIEFQPSARSNNNTASNIHSLSATTVSQVILATTLVTVRETMNVNLFRALLDQGSQASFVSERAAQLLKLSRKSINVSVSGIGAGKEPKVKGLVTLTLILPDARELRFEAYVLDKLTKSAPLWHVTPEVRDELLSFNLADPKYDEPGRIDIILGASVYGKLITGELYKLKSGPIVQRTAVGWIVSGGIDNNHTDIHNFKAETKPQENLNQHLRKFWELEEVHFTSYPSEEDRYCENFYRKNTYRNKEGRYVTKLPFKENMDKHVSGASRAIALTSLLALERRFKRNPELKTQYTQCIHEYLSLGHMHKANDTMDVDYDQNGNQRCINHYLPHHVVYKDSSTTQARVVFDASRKTSSGISFNEALCSGPTLLNDLTKVILNWRLFEYAFIADIEKMYRQILVQPDDSNLQRILWRDDPMDPISDYALDTVTFGVTSAPYLAIRTLHKLAEDSKFTCPMAHQAILEEIHVDDLLSGSTSFEEALAKIDQIKSTLDSAGFKLRKWVANNDALLARIRPEDQAQPTCLEINPDNNIKTLGILWHPFADEFSYKITIDTTDSIITKRKMLSEVAKLFDPLRWISPIIIAAKVLIQFLWLDGADWDDEVSTEILHKWKTFTCGLVELRNLRIPRWLKVKNDKTLIIHGFCDASQSAYAAAAYLVTQNGNTTSSSLLISKTKVAPIKSISIPRLELCGALLLAKMAKRLTQLLRKHDLEIHLWTDSTIVLAWLSKPPSHWATFVANRTTEILELTKDTPWRHVPTDQNPADLASRGTTTSALLANTLWWNGPTWLIESHEHWPQRPSITHCDLEQRKKCLVSLLVGEGDMNDKELLLQRFSSLTKLIRITAYCFRFIALLKKQPANTRYSNTTELENASKFWIRYAQQMELPEDLTQLQKNKPLAQNSKILNLNPFLDSDGIMRVGGRLTHSNLTFLEKHPIILFKRGRFTELLLEWVHHITLHGEVQLMLSTVRKRYWILDDRNVIRKIIHQCMTCFKTKAKTITQLMGNLPAPRVTISRPFTHTGVDYCGPLLIKDRKGRGGSIRKGYVALFICLAVKAIHLELVTELSTEAFLAAFRRFCGRRGCCTHIYSDCGTNFVGANAELKRMHRQNETLAGVLSSEGITWHFNPPASPHFGGFWEAGVKSLKRHLRKVVGESILTYKELNTTLIQIEGCLNSRPLTPLTNDPSDLTALAPAHFLIGETLAMPPEINLTEIKLNSLNRWQLTQRISQDFWRRWSTDYLSRLQQRPKWVQRQSNVQKGELCLVKDDHLPSYKWSLGRIIEVHPGNDSITRVVTVRTRSATYKRPITKIAILPFENTQYSPNENLHSCSPSTLYQRNTQQNILAK